MTALGVPAEQILESLRFCSRDNARGPMQWDDSRHAGFTTGGPWAPVNQNAAEINVEAVLADPDSVLHHYRKLIALRHELPVVALGDFTMLLEQDPTVYAFTRSLDGVTLLVVANFSSEETQVDFPDAAGWAASELVLGNYPHLLKRRDLSCSRGKRGSSGAADALSAEKQVMTRSPMSEQEVRSAPRGRRGDRGRRGRRCGGGRRPESR